MELCYAEPPHEQLAKLREIVREQSNRFIKFMNVTLDLAGPNNDCYAISNNSQLSAARSATRRTAALPNVIIG